MDMRKKKITKIIFRLVAVVIIAVLAVSSFYFITKNVAVIPTTSESPAQSQAVSSIKIVGNHFYNASGQEIRLIGVDTTGTEDQCIQNKGFSRYTLNNTQAKYIASWHVDAVRVLLNEDCWLGINGAPAAYSGAAYRQQIKQWVTDLNNNGMYVIIGLDWTAPGADKSNQQWPMADADHTISLWEQVAQMFKNNHAVLFDDFNEPFMGNKTPSTADWACWLNGCSYTNTCTGGIQHCSVTTYQTAGEQQMINAIRSTGATQPIEISSLEWSNDPCGLYDKGGNGGSCMILKYLPKDPDNQLALSTHLYYTSECNTLSCFNNDQLVVNKHIPVVVDEFGEKDCKVSFDNMVMNWGDQNSISYLAWAWKADTVNSSTCIGNNVKTTANNNMNLELLSNYNGGLDTVSPEPADIKAHFQTASWYLSSAKVAPTASTKSAPKNSWVNKHHSLLGEMLAGLAVLVLAIWIVIELVSHNRRKNPDPPFTSSGPINT
ncbi:MAG: cellulase family glycosylhydrolase [Candidatus Saccharimonadales bacterium]